MSKQIGIPGSPIRTRIGWSKNLGDFVERVYRGNESYINGLAADLRGNANEYMAEQIGGPLHELTARWSKNPEDEQGEVPIKRFRLSGNRHGKSLFNIPRFAMVSDSDVSKIRRFMGEGTDYTDPEVDALSSEARTLFRLMLSGIEYLPMTQPVLIVEQIANDNFDFSPQEAELYAQVGSIFSTPLLESLLGVNLKFALPDEHDPPNDFAFGWLKNYPEYSDTSNSKAILLQDWEYGLWSTDLYGDLIE